MTGGLSTGNIIAGNTIGSNFSHTEPILTSAAGFNVYDTSGLATNQDRQNYGVWLNGVSGNTVGVLNTIQGNQVGIEVDGNFNTITNNVIGSLAYTLGESNVDGLGNFFGVYIANSSFNTVASNYVSRNVSVGVAIVGAAAVSNSVQANAIQANGGYAVPLVTTTQPTVTLIDYPTAAADTSANPSSVSVFGSGVYIQSGEKNSVVGNTIQDNTQVGVYVFNFGTISSTSNTTNNKIVSVPIYNVIQQNVITGVQHPAGPYNGDYGVLLFDSSGNLPGVPQVGPTSNNIQGNRIANFREYTGPSSIVNSTLQLPASSTSTVRAMKGSRSSKS